MKKLLLQEKLPIFVMEVDKSETELKPAQKVTNYFIQLIVDHKVSRLIGEFDYYRHPKGIAGGEMADNIIDTRNIVFCFGIKLSSAEVLAMRLRSIGIAETETGFILSR